MRRIRCAFILGCAAAMALSGCGKGVKDGTGQDKSSDGGSILQSYDSEIKLNDKKAGESGETLNTYWYAVGSDSDKLNYRLNTRGGIEGAMAQARSVKKLSLISMWKEMAEIYGENGMTEVMDRIWANYYDSLLSGYLQCEYYRYDNYKVLMADFRKKLKSSLGRIMKN